VDGIHDLLVLGQIFYIALEKVVEEREQPHHIIELKPEVVQERALLVAGARGG
jgi:hypothetical protein